MTDDELPENLVPKERHWALSADFLAACTAIAFCIAAVAVMASMWSWR